MNKWLNAALCCCVSFGSAAVAHGQGTFQNLDFELADPSGYSPNSNDLPTGSGFPGWVVTYSSPGFGTNVATSVWYDALSIGGAINKSPGVRSQQLT